MGIFNRKRNSKFSGLEGASIAAPRSNKISNNNENNVGPFASSDPEALFKRYDEDDSGTISFNEFTKMLKELNINISEAKARKYFSGKCM